MKQPKLTRRGFLAGTAATGAAAAMALSGCGGGKSSSSSSAASSATGSPADEITAACAYTSTVCNPVGNSSALMLAATWHVFEGLYEIDLHNYKTYNALAAAEPVKIDDLTYEVTLRDGAVFSDGTPVTSADVVNAFEANLANDLYKGLLPFLTPGSVTTKDDTTVTFKLKYPFEALLTGRLALVKIFPATMTKEQLDTKPIGTGPWKYESINGDTGGFIEFVPNDNYNGKYPATCKKMSWNVLVDETSRTTAITDGSVLAIESVPAANSKQVANSGATVEDVPSFALPFLMFNCKKAPFDDVRVRQALFYAIDVEKLIANAMDGHGTPVSSFLPESYANYHRASTVYTYDADKAKTLLKEAGQENLTFEFRTNANWVQTLAAPIIEDWKAVGITVTNKETQGSAMFSDLSAADAAKGVLPYDVALSPGDPSCFGNDTDLLLSWWYDSPSWTEGRTCWAGTPECTELQGLMQQAREEADPKKQQEIWNKCFDIVAEQVPLYPLFHREISTGYIAEKLEDFAPISTTGLVFLGTTPLS